MQKYTPHRRIHHQVGGAPSNIPDPIHYYAMDGTAGATDIGTLADTDLTEGGTVTEVTGKIGNARAGWSGANYLRDLSGTLAAILTDDASDWSMIFWFRTGTVVATKYPFQAVNFHTYINQYNKMLFYFGPATLTSTVTLTASTYHFGAIGNEAGVGKWMSINDQATPDTSATLTSTSTGTFYAGLSWPADGHVDDFGFFDSDIRGAPLTELYGGGTSPKSWNGSSWA